MRRTRTFSFFLAFTWMNWFLILLFHYLSLHLRSLNFCYHNTCFLLLSLSLASANIIFLFVLLLILLLVFLVFLVFLFFSLGMTLHYCWTFWVVCSIRIQFLHVDLRINFLFSFFFCLLLAFLIFITISWAGYWKTWLA